MRATRNWIEKVERWLAWKLPRGILRWAFYRVCADATSGRWSDKLVLGMTWETAITRWEKGDGPCCTHAGDCDESCECDRWCCPQEPNMSNQVERFLRTEQLSPSMEKADEAG